MKPPTFLIPKDGEPDNRQPLDEDFQLPCKTVYYKEANGKTSSIHFTLRVPEPLPKESSPDTKYANPSTQQEE